ncbi:IucA/IucC family protein [Aurantivibrio plasticivorans]
MKNLIAMADFLSANSFFNAYVREFDNWRLTDKTANDDDGKYLAISMEKGDLFIPIQYWSTVGRHRFLNHYQFSPSTDCKTLAVTFTLAVTYIAEYLTACDIQVSDEFVARVIESRDNVAHSLMVHEHHLDDLFKPSATHEQAFLNSEQSLLLGHSVHPTPKIRQPLSQEEMATYCTENPNGFRLQWLAVNPEKILYRCADEMRLDQRIESLISSDPDINPDHWNLPDGFLLVPTHPWQLQQIRSSKALANAFNHGDIIELGVAGSHWYATSSIRSLYNPHNQYMLKFSLSIRLTNSIRHLQIKELERGCLISHLLNAKPGQQLKQSQPQFSIIEEPAYLCLCDDDGNPLVETALVFRDNPFVATTSRDNRNHIQHHVLAALTQDNPSNNQSSLSHLVKKLASQNKTSDINAASHWFNAFLHCVVTPLMTAQAQAGLLFGAHQQNIILTTTNYLPTHAYFRDCQGTGLSKLGEKLFATEILESSTTAENQLDREMGNKLFGYYLVINSVFSVISTIATDGLGDESEYLQFFRDSLEELRRQGFDDPSFIEYLLTSPTLWQKGNFICSLSDINENTMSNPLELYQAIENPLLTNIYQSQQVSGA